MILNSVVVIITSDLRVSIANKNQTGGGKTDEEIILPSSLMEECMCCMNKCTGIFFLITSFWSVLACIM